MIEAFSFRNAHQFGDSLASQARLRYRVFVLDRSLPHHYYDGMEYDEFDTPAAVYLVWRDPKMIVRGLIRMIPTSVPYMLKSYWPFLCQTRDLPAAEDVWEASRICVDRSYRAFAIRHPRRHLHRRRSSTAGNFFRVRNPSSPWRSPATRRSWSRAGKRNCRTYDRHDNWSLITQSGHLSVNQVSVFCGRQTPLAVGRYKVRSRPLRPLSRAAVTLWLTRWLFVLGDRFLGFVLVGS